MFCLEVIRNHKRTEELRDSKGGVADSTNTLVIEFHSITNGKRNKNMLSL